MDIRWRGPEFERLVSAHVRRNIAAACIFLVSRLKEVLNVEGTGVQESESKSSKKKKKLIYNANPSAPGESPHKQTGRLLGSVAHEIAALVGRVGTNIKYGRWLELGTKRMAARPWLRKSLYRFKAVISRILCRPMD